MAVLHFFLIISTLIYILFPLGLVSSKLQKMLKTNFDKNFSPSNSLFYVNPFLILRTVMVTCLIKNGTIFKPFAPIEYKSYFLFTILGLQHVGFFFKNKQT